MAQKVKNLPAMQETGVRFLNREDPLWKEMSTHSSTLAWKIPWTEEPGGLQSMGSQKVRRAGYIYISCTLPRSTCNWPKEVLVVTFQNPLGGFKNIQALHCRPFKCSFWGWGPDILVEVCLFVCFFFFSLKWFPRVARIENPFNPVKRMPKGTYGPHLIEDSIIFQKFGFAVILKQGNC